MKGSTKQLAGIALFAVLLFRPQGFFGARP